MKFYNTLSRKVEVFTPYDNNNVKMYTCGPTVYHFAHIGNLRTYIMEDILEKTLKFLGYNVTRAMNITDVGHLTSDGDTGEDKMIKGAKREHKTVLEIADYYTKAFFDDFTKLNNKKPDIIVNATSLITDYIEMISKLLEKGYAYISSGNVYFDTSKLDEYYKLTNTNKEQLKEAVRDDVDIDDAKKNKNDFVLWFTKSKFESQELKWNSPWGEGYPGWHIECSGIALKYLGERLDIHCGGVDNIFPHHTNEIAQSESLIGHKWCNYWFHSAHLNDETGKMSKSKGDFLTVSLLEEKGYNPLSYRFFCLQSHYRSTLTFSYENLDAAQNAYNKLINKIRSLSNEGNISNTDSFLQKFKEALGNDLNTSNAITVLYDTLKSDLNDASKRYLIAKYDEVLSLDLLKEKEVDNNIIEKVQNKIKERNEAKKNKDFVLADKIRDELLEEGILLKDTKEGTIFEVL